MFKLTVVAGPNRGSSFALQQGEVLIGRQVGNTIVLSSQKVSKTHCKLVVSNGEVILQDESSANGTFVNGVRAKNRKINPGDRIGVGEFVLELVEPSSRLPGQAPTVYGLGNVVQFPKSHSGSHSPSNVTHSIRISDPNKPPAEFKEKVIWYFDKFLMPFFYGLNFKHDWRVICAGLFGVIAIGNLIISIPSLLQANQASLIKEISRRAQFMAKQLVERNVASLANRSETTVDIGGLEREEGVRLAVITDMDNRIIAPAVRMNQYLTHGAEARLAVQAKNAFLKGREVGYVIEADAKTVVAIEPVKVLDPRVSRNVIVGMAIVGLDTTLATLSAGDVGMVYSETLILNGILLALVFLVLYRLTLKPFQVLNDDIDKVLKGEMTQVTHEFKSSELDQLWEVINSALQRVPKSGSAIEGGSTTGGFGSGPSPEEFAAPLQILGGISKFGMVLCDGDRKVLYMNSLFEEITGLRLDSSLGQPLALLARDQAFGSLCNDLFDRSPAGGPGISEDFDFSGIFYRMHSSAFGSLGGSPKCFLLVTERKEE